MAYVDGNPKTKKQLREWVNDPNRAVTVYQPGPFGNGPVPDGEVSIEGPHGFHRWYARVTVASGQIVKIKG